MNAGRRILHVITGLGVGGAEANLAQLMLRGGLADSSAVVSLVPGGHFANVLREHGVRLLELDFRRPGGFVGGLRRLAGEIDDFAPDLVQGWMYHGNLAASFARAVAATASHEGRLRDS